MLMHMMGDKMVYFGILKVVSIHCSVVHLVPVILIYVLLCSNFSETSYFCKVVYFSFVRCILHGVLVRVLELLGGKLPKDLISRSFV